MKKISKLLYCLMFMLMNAYGQETSIKGLVADENEKPIPYVNIHNEDSGKRFQTDSLGRFVITGDIKPATFIFSSTGFLTREVAGNVLKSDGKVILVKNENMIEEVVINTGYETIPQDRATGSFGFVDKNTLETMPSRNLLERLEGKVPGLQFDHRGSSPSLNVRGLNSFTEGGSQPLIVVDNFPYVGRIEDLNPNDIESMSILKDAAAASIWGTRAGNGVIVITTKQGGSEKIEVNIAARAFISDKPNLFYYPRMSSKDFMEVERFLFDQGFYTPTYTSSLSNRFVFSPLVDLLFAHENGEISDALLGERMRYWENIDYRDDLLEYVYRGATNQQYHAEISSNSSNHKYRLAMGYDKGTGNVRNTDDSRVSLRLTNILQATNKLKFESNVSYSSAMNRNSASVPGYPIVPGGGKTALYPYAELMDVNGNSLAVPRNYNFNFVNSDAVAPLLDWKYRPLDDLDATRYSLDSRHFYLNFRTSYQILKSLGVSLIYGYENQSGNSDRINTEKSFYTRDLINRFTQIVDGQPKYILPRGDIYNTSSNTLQSHRVRGQINYTENLSENSRINLLAGGEIFAMTSDNESSGSYGYNSNVLTRKNVDYVNPFPIFGNLAGASYITPFDSYNGSVSRTVSLYANGSFEYLGRYILSLSARRDGSNAFGASTNDRWNPLWSSGLSWNLSRENFLEHVNWLDNLRLRSTLGFSGIQASRSVSQTTIRYSSSSPYTNLRYAEINSPPNPSLRWETVKMFNLGMDFSLFDGKFNGSAEYFTKRSFDLISSDPMDATTGYSFMDRNVGAIETKGIDLNLAANVNFGKLNWRPQMTVSYTKNRVSEYKGGIGATAIYMEGGRYVSPILDKSLYPVFSYKFAGLDPENGDPQGIYNNEVSKDYSSLIADSLENLNYHGTALAPLYGSFNNNFSFGQFYMNINILFRLGHHFKKETIVYSGLYNSWSGHQDYERRWKQPGDEYITDIPSRNYPADNNRDNFFRNSTVNIERADLVRLQNVQIGYNFMWSAVGVRGQVYGGMTNVGLLWRKNNVDIDPDYNSLPPPAITNLGISFTF